VDESVVLFLSLLSDIGGETGSDEIERVDEGEGGCSCCSSGDHSTEELTPVGIVSLSIWEKCKVDRVVDGKVEGLGWEVSHHVGTVSFPVGHNSFLLWHLDQTIPHSLVHSWLGLQEEFATFERCIDGLGDSSRHSSDNKVN